MMKILVLIFTFFEVAHLSNTANTPCKLQTAKFGLVCVCTENYCDYLENPIPQNNTEVHIISSSQSGLRFSTSVAQFNTGKIHQIMDYNDDTILPHNDLKIHSLNVRRKHEYQKIVGFGGGFTGSVSYVLDKLDQSLQDEIYKSYFHDDGVRYNMLRLSIGGSDFDLSPWVYNEEPPNDIELTNFTQLSPLDMLKIEQMQRLKEISKRNKIKIMAATWSSPTWMKTNGQWTGFSKLKREYYQTWANYYLKWLELMEANGVRIWAISTGNEPLSGIYLPYFVPFISMGWLPEDQGIWVGDNLGPTIRNSKYKNVLIFSNDDQRGTFPEWFYRMNASRSGSVEYLDGLSTHWYWDEIIDFNLIELTASEMPDKLFLNTESCIGNREDVTHGPELGSWNRAERYARVLIQDFQHHYNGWIDWNLVLDEHGGPNYANNYVDAAIIVNLHNRKEFYKQPMYYIMGHFSKFLPEDSKHIMLHVHSNKITAIAFKRPDTTICLIVFNSESSRSLFTIRDSVRGSLQLEIPPKSIHSIIYQ